MNKLNSILCERCGERFEVFSENSSKGSRCPGCGWSVVAADIPGIKVDETKYEVKCGGDYKDTPMSIYENIGSMPPALVINYGALYNKYRPLIDVEKRRDKK